MAGGIQIQSLLSLAALNRENEQRNEVGAALRAVPLKDRLHHLPDRPQLLPLSLIAPQVDSHGIAATTNAQAGTDIRLPALNSITSQPNMPVNLIAAQSSPTTDSITSTSNGRKRRKTSNTRPEPPVASLNVSAPSTGLTLPKPPTRRAREDQSGRIPPVISGLFDPPDEVRRIPGISDGILSFDPKEAGTSHALVGRAAEHVEQATHSKRSGTYRSWDREEHKCLMAGVERFGFGQWKKILDCKDYKFKDGRNAVDLKDRFRRKHPEAYCTVGREAIRQRQAEQSSPAVAPSSEAQTSSRIITNLNNNAQKPSEPSSNLDRKRTGRRGRIPFTPEEDDAILCGFKKYGPQWQQIRSDPSLNLRHRHRTDLRDRHRNKFKRHGTAKALDEGEVVDHLRKLKSLDKSSIRSNRATNTRQIPHLEPISSHINSASTFPWSLLDSDTLDGFVDDGETVIRSGNVTLSRDIFDWADQQSVTHSATTSAGLDHPVQPPMIRSSQDTLPMLGTSDHQTTTTAHVTRLAHITNVSQTNQGMPIASMLAEDHEASMVPIWP